jgi:hypothetical protein
MNYKFGAALLTIAMIAVSWAPSQAAQDPNDLGIQDTARIELTLKPDANTNQLNVTLDLYIFNDAQGVGGTALGFGWINDQLRMTSGAFTSEALTAFDFIHYVYRNNKIDSTNKYDKFQFTSSRAQGPGLEPGSTAKHVATYHFTLSSWGVLDSLVFDTSKVLGALMTFVDFDNIEYTPFFNRRIVFYDAHRPVISNLVLSEDTLEFSAVEGQGNPASQTFRITSDRNPLTFSLIENTSWLLKAPSTGTTPQDITVSVTMTGVTAGTYLDSIRVESAGASNSPRFLFVRLLVEPPSPRIGVDRSVFYFNALVGGVNPASQTLNITNLSTSTLHWSVSNHTTWLALQPGSGVNSGSVTLSVTSSSMAFGQYYDTVVVTDPAASNSPVSIPVKLTLSSDMPIIVVDSTLNRWTVNWSAEGPMFTRSFKVRNGGPGSLNFRVEENSQWIVNVTPGEGAAPQEVTLLFYLHFDPLADTTIVASLRDTVWIYSDDAANSPVMVECFLRFPTVPAELNVSTHAMQFDVYECWQGYGHSLPSNSFTVTNVGGDNENAILYLSYPHDKLQVSEGVDFQTPPFTYQVTAKLPDTAIGFGTYVDTILVTSHWAINNPQIVEVTYNYMAGGGDAQVYVPVAPLIIPYQEDSGPQIYNGLQIYNYNPGCMNWQISENIDWLTATVPTGAVPDASPLLIDPSGYTLGEYPQTLTILSPGASNHPFPVEAILQVWKLRGDVNWNGRITVQDIACLLDYVFQQKHAPQPTAEVGDVDCDGTVGVADIVLMVDYLFDNLEPLCGNPY